MTDPSSQALPTSVALARAPGAVMLVIVALASLVAVDRASAAKTTKFWNLTAHTITSVRLAPAGTPAFGPDQAKNDKDGTVDHDERLKITGVTTGVYDARLTDTKGRTCLVKNISVRDGDVFSIEESQLTDCSK